LRITRYAFKVHGGSLPSHHQPDNVWAGAPTRRSLSHMSSRGLQHL
jgi:hypothetical protein